MKYKPTDKMKNGAIVIDYDAPSTVVVASFNGQFVTWKCDDDGNAYWGHYFDNVCNAVADFQKRVSENTPKH